MEDVGFAKKGSLSSSSSSSSSSLLASRLSPLAQPFTMKRQTSQPQQASSPLTSSNQGKPFAPSTSNHLDPIGLELIKDDQLILSEDSILSFKGFCGHSLIDESFTDKSLNETRSSSSAFESFLKHVPPKSGSSIADAALSTSSHVLTSTADLSSNGIKEIKVSSVSSNSSDPLTVAKTENEVTSKDSLYGLAVKNSGTVTKMLNEDEDDLDSPCWKGIRNSGKSNSPRSQSESGSPSLNPKAPLFFPSHAQGIGKCEYPTFDPLPEDQHLDLPWKNNPCHVEGIGSANGIVGDNRADFSLIATENTPIFSTSEDYSEVIQHLCKSPTNCPSINVSAMVKAIHHLSESLVRKYANDVVSLDDQDREMLHDSIDNLDALVNHRNYRKKSEPSHGHEVKRRSATDFEWGNSYSLVATNKTPHGLVPSSTESGVIPVLRKTAVKENCWIDEEVHQKALLNLLIEAESALCSTKYENHVLRIKLQKAEFGGGVKQI